MRSASLIRSGFVATAAALAGVALTPGSPIGAAAIARPGGAQKAARRGRAPWTARFAVTYSGRGAWTTVYHSEPPNPGGAHDTNDARDSGTQRWTLHYSSDLVISPCVSGRARGRCERPAFLSGATGVTRATGSIDHRHLDGLYSYDNATERCRVTAATPPRTALQSVIAVDPRPRLGAVAVQAQIPVADVLTLLPTECPGQGDSLDGLADNYFTPGFSFAPGYGPDRWFTSRSVLIPLRVLRRSARIVIHLSQTRAGTPPRGCAVHAAFARCHTGGSWQGRLTLSAVRSSATLALPSN